MKVPTNNIQLWAIVIKVFDPSSRPIWYIMSETRKCIPKIHAKYLIKHNSKILCTSIFLLLQQSINNQKTKVTNNEEMYIKKKRLRIILILRLFINREKGNCSEYFRNVLLTLQIKMVAAKDKEPLIRSSSID